MTELKTSSIHGIGVFSLTHIAKGDTVWALDPMFDAMVPVNLIRTRYRIDPVLRHLTDTTANSFGTLLPNTCVYYVDNARFINHSDSPNIENVGLSSVAIKDILPNDEITADYCKFLDPKI